MISNGITTINRNSINNPLKSKYVNIPETNAPKNKEIIQIIISIFHHAFFFFKKYNDKLPITINGNPLVIAICRLLN